MYGLYFDDPDSKALVDLCSEACVSVPEDFALLTTDAPVHLTHTSSGRCARMLFTGPYAQLNTAYAWLYKIWLPHSGEQPGSQPPMEEYLNDPRSTAPAKLQTAIYIPLQEAAQ